MQQNKTKQIIAKTVALIAISLLVVGVKVFIKPQASESAQSTPLNGSSNSSSTKKNAYKDGNYTATGSYISPAGTQSIKVNLLLKNGVVSDATVESQAVGPDSREFQAKFISGFKKFVVGHDADDIQISHVSGSSLTSEGFKDALEQIKNQARGT